VVSVMSGTPSGGLRRRLDRLTEAIVPDTLSA